MNGLAFLALILSVVISCVAAWIVALRYRRAMQRLMRAGSAGDATPWPDEGAAPLSPPATISLAGNRAAGMRLSLLLVAVSCLIAVSSACLWWTLSFPREPMAPKRVRSSPFFTCGP